jgi:predicted aminopeptidase
MRFKNVVRVSAFLGLLLTAGCEVDYYAHLVFGELASLSNTVPVTDALEDARLSEEEQAELRLVQDVRLFGIEQIGLTAGDAYTLFEWNGSDPPAYALSASEKDSLTSHVWWLLLFGPSEVRFFFDEDRARAEAEATAALDLDVFLGKVDGFSTLGFLPDPIRQSNLQDMDGIDLAELILHEMTHSTVFNAADANFNESLATFVGRTAAMMWFDQTYGAGSAEAEAARDRFADKAVIDEYIDALYARMVAYYEEAAANGMPRDAIVAGREAEFEAARAAFLADDLPRLNDPERWRPMGDVLMNNAALLAGVRYQASLSDYQAVLDKVGGHFPDALVVFEEAAASADSREYIRAWARDH